MTDIACVLGIFPPEHGYFTTAVVSRQCKVLCDAWQMDSLVVLRWHGSYLPFLSNLLCQRPDVALLGTLGSLLQIGYLYRNLPIHHLDGSGDVSLMQCKDQIVKLLLKVASFQTGPVSLKARCSIHIVMPMAVTAVDGFR